MGTNINAISSTFTRLQISRGDTQLQGFNSTITIFMSDGFDTSNGSGYSSKQGFLSTIMGQTSSPEYHISMQPSSVVAPIIHGKYKNNKVSYTQRKDDVASLILGQQRPEIIVEENLNLGDQFIMATFQNVYDGDSDNLLIPNDIPVFLVDSWEPIYNENGEFQYGIIIFERLTAWVVRKMNGEVKPNEVYNAFEYLVWFFYRANIQPNKAKRLRISYTSTIVNWLLDIKNSDNLSVDWNYTKNTTGQPFISPYLMIKGGSSNLNVIPQWINEIGYWNANSNRIQHDGGATDTRYITTDGDGYWQPTADPEGIKSGLPNHQYKNAYAFIGPAGGVAQKDELRRNIFAQASDLMDFKSPYAFMGQNYTDDYDKAQTDLTLPRKEQQSSAVWKTYSKEAYFYSDVATNVLGAVVTSEMDIIYSTALQRSKNKEFMSNYWIMAKELLSGSLNLYGSILTKKPPTSLQTSFDTNDLPENWNKDEMMQYVGVVFLNGSISTYGQNTDLKTKSINIGDLPEKQTRKFTYGIGNLYDVMWRTGGASKVKSYTSGLNWYTENGQSRFKKVIEIEWTDATKITQFLWKYFGGFEFKMEWFENSYNNSLTYGDIPVKYINNNGDEEELPPAIYQADNRRGNPYSLETNIVYGGTESNKVVLMKINKKKILNNFDEVIDIETGEYIPNPYYKKGVK